MPLANVQNDEFEVTRGTVSWFSSTDVAQRGFCRDCGTPLIYRSMGAPHINITLGSLDHPSQIEPAEQFGLEARMPWFDQLADLEGHSTMDDPQADQHLLEIIRRTNHQHPDHDTGQWPDTGSRQ